MQKVILIMNIPDSLLNEKYTFTGVGNRPSFNHPAYGFNKTQSPYAGWFHFRHSFTGIYIHLTNRDTYLSKRSIIMSSVSSVTPNAHHPGYTSGRPNKISIKETISQYGSYVKSLLILEYHFKKASAVSTS